MGQSKSSSRSPPNDDVKGWNRELLKSRVKNRRILGLDHEVRKKEGTGTPTARVMNTKGKAVQLTNPLARHKSK